MPLIVLVPEPGNKDSNSPAQHLLENACKHGQAASPWDPEDMFLARFGTCTGLASKGN